MHTEEERKIIDTFMGSKGEYISHKDQWGGEVWGEYRPTNYLMWENLMDVVLKINLLDDYRYSVYIYTMDTEIADDKKEYRFLSECKWQPNELRKSVYEAVLDFIKWYNEQNK